MTNPEQRLIVTDLDGTLLHDAPTFEERFITQRSIDTVKRMHDAGYRFAVATARPVSTGFEYAGKLPVDAYIYLNGALIDFAPERSDYDLLTSGRLPSDGHLLKVGFSSARACEVCRYLLDEIPGLSLGVVMDDVRYTNFDVSVYWKTQIGNSPISPTSPTVSPTRSLSSPSRSNGTSEDAGSARFRRGDLRRLDVDADESAGEQAAGVEDAVRTHGRAARRYRQFRR